MEQEQQQKKTRCFTSGRGFFVRLPVSESNDVDESEVTQDQSEASKVTAKALGIIPDEQR